MEGKKRKAMSNVPRPGMVAQEMDEFCPKLCIPWERERASHHLSPEDEHYCKHLATDLPKFKSHRENWYIDGEAKRALMKVSKSVVALGSYIDGEEFRHGSGTVIESYDMMNIVLTSANIFRRAQDVVKNKLPDDLKITVLYSSRGESYVGDVLAYDYHYNLAIIRVQSETPFSVAKIAVIDDSLSSLNPPSGVLRPHAKSYILAPGNGVIAVARYFYPSFDLMGACGFYCLARSKLNCKELFMTTCSVTGCGDGGPLINYNGEVIGVFFSYFGWATPFMPVNIALMWWKYYKLYGKNCQLSLGIEATNLYAANLDVIERVIMKFPSVSKGVIVEKVMPGSSAHLAGLYEGDVIIICDGKPVQSFLQFYEIMWNKVGKLVELVVARQDSGEHVNLSMLAVEARQDQFNSWPRT